MTERTPEQHPRRHGKLYLRTNPLFDDVFRSFDHGLPAVGALPTFNVGWPSVEISKTDKEINVTAEIPGLKEKDVDVLLDNGVLTLKGEKRLETQDKERQFSERFYGHFERRFPLGVEVKEDRIDAHFRNGVLSVVLAKSAKAQSQVKRAAIKH
ncbi:Hsp20/alpha crystallin family protein [Ancylobacter defluvii]|uniref:Heat-shock protein Hsp20 n=1 Tax=Ancylobacter defluvii TaxID=1282440 RepID=A0A9W6JV55_9HYPH|nr:Hsp20/alpha crystallin family protein [Ancylobacter defluvii]MBS7590074.1 Hsp20/alpha crystallin family protein [Ancylobacter defluvii]GLK82685.1 heat-shock protein Hsp20 [Ancylobacter defluvii]